MVKSFRLTWGYNLGPSDCEPSTLPLDQTPELKQKKKRNPCGLLESKVISSKRAKKLFIFILPPPKPLSYELGLATSQRHLNHTSGATICALKTHTHTHTERERERERWW